MKRLARYQESEEVDFVIIGSGAAGGVMARELSEAGFRVVVLEQGPYLRPEQFVHDEYSVWFKGGLVGNTQDFPSTFRPSDAEEAQVPAGGFGALVYARMVGGASCHFTGNFWRFRPVDFVEGTLTGGIEGTGLEDWPINYEELEPYYSKVEWDIGVSGAPAPGDPPRSRPYPVPPLPVKSSGVLLEEGARALGWTPQPAPMAILSEAHNGRPSCIQCGWCMGFGCEVNAKSSTLASMIPLAEATGRCEIRPLSTVYKIETDARGRARGVLYFDETGASHEQRARAVVLVRQRSGVGPPAAVVGQLCLPRRAGQLQWARRQVSHVQRERVGHRRLRAPVERVQGAGRHAARARRVLRFGPDARILRRRGFGRPDGDWAVVLRARGDARGCAHLGEPSSSGCSRSTSRAPWTCSATARPCPSSPTT